MLMAFHRVSKPMALIKEEAGGHEHVTRIKTTAVGFFFAAVHRLPQCNGASAYCYSCWERWWEAVGRHFGEHLRGDMYLESIFMTMIPGDDYIPGISAVFNDSCSL